MFKILKAPRVIVTGLFKFNHGRSATRTKYWDIFSFCLDISESPTYTLMGMSALWTTTPGVCTQNRGSLRRINVSKEVAQKSPFM